VFSKEWNSQILENLLMTSVPRCTGSNANTLRLKHLHFPGMGAGSRPPDGACVVHHRMDELLIQQHSISDGETSSPNACVTNQPTRELLIPRKSTSLVLFSHSCVNRITGLSDRHLQL